MLQIIFLALASGGLAAFMLNRLYVLFTQNQINVKGFVYSRKEMPAFYWFWVIAATFGLLAGSVLFILSAAVLIGRMST